MFKFMKRLFKGPDREFFHKVASFNHPGFPSNDLTWDKAIKLYPAIPFQVLNPPSWCHECGTDLKVQYWDWQKIENSGQYMVITYTCPNGHGHYGDCA